VKEQDNGDWRIGQQQALMLNGSLCHHAFDHTMDHLMMTLAGHVTQPVMAYHMVTHHVVRLMVHHVMVEILVHVPR
jgi:hypothetical protein